MTGENLEAYLQPTKYCDSQHPAITKLADEIAADCQDPFYLCWPPSKTDYVRAVYDTIREVPYAFDQWQRTASETLALGKGMCFNKANLQVALLRNLGIPAGYVIVELWRESLKSSLTKEAYELLQPTFRHCYAAAWLDGRWRSLDATTDPLLAKAQGWTPPQFTGKEDIRPPPHERATLPIMYANIDDILDAGPRLKGADLEKVVRESNAHFEELRRRAKDAPDPAGGHRPAYGG
jgi:transglutaminase-like putative cysteine protease